MQKQSATLMHIPKKKKKTRCLQKFIFEENSRKTLTILLHVETHTKIPNKFRGIKLEL